MSHLLQNHLPVFLMSHEVREVALKKIWNRGSHLVGKYSWTNQEVGKIWVGEAKNEVGKLQLLSNSFLSNCNFRINIFLPRVLFVAAAITTASFKELTTWWIFIPTCWRGRRNFWSARSSLVVKLTNWIIGLWLMFRGPFITTLPLT